MSIKKIVTSSQVTIREAMSQMDRLGRGFLAVASNDRVIGIVTDGDIRRAILRNVNLDTAIKNVMNADFISITSKNPAEIEHIFKTTWAKHIPVLNKGRLIDVIFEEEYFQSREKVLKSKKILKDIPAVIMAGGLGTRLDPFTRILPKPLIPIGEKPIIEVIIEQFLKNGIDNFYISVNHKARMIKAFFEEAKRDYDISFIEEDEPLGTAGSLRFLKGRIKSEFIVSNCDILIEGDYRLMHQFHGSERNALTIVASMQKHIIPYGVCTTSKNGILKELKEKPHYDVLVNTGMYLMSPEVLEFIPARKFDITDLIKALKKKGKRIGVYPISEKSWVDIGQWEEYKQSMQKLSMLK